LFIFFGSSSLGAAGVVIVAGIFARMMIMMNYYHSTMRTKKQGHRELILSLHATSPKAEVLY
jgi:uncharacterized protein YqjF (DUF2071 family)